MEEGRFGVFINKTISDQSAEICRGGAKFKLRTVKKHKLKISEDKIEFLWFCFRHAAAPQNPEPLVLIRKMSLTFSPIITEGVSRKAHRSVG